MTNNNAHCFYMQLKCLKDKSPNEFALKTGIEYLNEIRLSVGEGQESIMDDNQTLTGQ